MNASDIDNLQGTYRRFWEKVTKDGPVVKADLGNCWDWTACTDDFGYGVINIKVNGRWRTIDAHRLSVLLDQGGIPDDLCSLHHCDRPCCVRPTHLFVGTRADNNADMEAKGRRRSATGEHSGAARHPESITRGTQRAEAKLAEEDIPLIRSLWPEISQRKIAAQFGVSRALVRNVLARRKWKHVA